VPEVSGAEVSGAEVSGAEVSGAELFGAELFGPGDLVTTARADPPHHTRLPRYVRGAVGTVVECHGRYPLPDNRARQLPAEPEPVYTVRFSARELFGGDRHGPDHFVTVDLWESYLRPGGTS
jgi:nitrile hydratase subunit beta